mgnify:CR=1 FL=1
MSLARDIADLGAVTTRLDTVGASSGALSNRNLVINGAMMVAQRATSVSSQTGSGYKTIDRIYTNASGSTYNQSQQTVTLGGETGLPTEFTKFLRHDVTTSNDNAHFYHMVEDVSSVPEGTVTLSFYAKGTTPTGGLSFRAYQNFGTGGSPSGEVTITISDTVTLTSTWQRFSVNITVPSITGKTLGTDGNHKFYFGIGQFANTSTNAYQLDITGVQLEVGDTATDFEHRTFGDELARCERYLFRTYEYGTTAGTAGRTSCIGRYVDGTQNYAAVQVPHNKMRAVPTVVVYSTSDGATGNLESDGGNKAVATQNIGSSAGGFINVNNSSVSTSQGIRCHVTLDAEL